jgi:hypothetical protein
MCEDRRGGLGLDRAHDDADRRVPLEPRRVWGFTFPIRGQAAARWYFVDESSESVMACDRADCLRWRRVGCLEHSATVGPFVVVVLEVLAEDAVEVAFVADQEPVEALCADGADEALRVGVAQPMGRSGVGRFRRGGRTVCRSR